MQRKQDGLVPVQKIRDASPQALHRFTQADQVNQLVSASEADPDLGFMARTMALCSLPRSNPDQRGHLNRMLRLALPFFVDATFCAQTLAQMRRHPELAVWAGDSCLHEPHRRSSRDRSGWP